jgi:hypothetical protein
MSLYILPENQKLIWDSMSVLPQFQRFSSEFPGKQEEWFRDIIQKFYESNKFKLLSVHELQQLNRDTVSYMMSELKELSFPSSVQSTTKTFSFDTMAQNNGYTSFNSQGNSAPFTMKFPESSAESKSVTRDFISEKKQEELNRVFSERQKEYEVMNIKKPAHEVDFRMNIEEKPIENMDELIRHHMEQRESSLKEYTPPNTRLIDDMEIIDLDSSRSFTREDVNKKNVRWSPNLEQTAARKHQPIVYSNEQYPKPLAKKEVAMDRSLLETLIHSVQSLKAEIDSLKTNRPVHASAPKNTPTFVQGHNPLVSNILSRLRKKETANNYTEDDMQNINFTYDELNH